MLYTEVSYTIYNGTELHKAGTVGLAHAKNLTVSEIKTFLRKSLSKDQKKFQIDVASKEPISEEDAIHRYGNRLVELSRKRRY